MQQPKIELIESEHRYFIDGVERPSVTQIIDAVLSDMYLIPAHVLEPARQLGTAVHVATALDDSGCLDESTVHPVVRPYLEAYRRFRRERRFTPLVIEQKVYSARYCYAGTLDRIGFFDSGGALVQLDIKSGMALPEVGPQTAAYDQAFFETTGERAQERGALYLQDDGSYVLRPCHDPSDFSTFLAALQIYNYRLKHRKRNNGGRT